MSSSSSEERRWDRLAVIMEQFHNHFKVDFERIYKLADGSFNEQRMTLRMFLREADNLKKYLTTHHTIEERHLFPVLAKRMPTFADNERHLESHHGIHEGLDKMDELVRRWREDPTLYSPTEMRACLDSFRDVLMRHLDEEVNDLRGENMKKYWTLEEVDRLLI